MLTTLPKKNKTHLLMTRQSILFHNLYSTLKVLTKSVSFKKRDWEESQRLLLLMVRREKLVHHGNQMELPFPNLLTGGTWMVKTTWAGTRTSTFHNIVAPAGLMP
jgi:hypothetical protein